MMKKLMCIDHFWLKVIAVITMTLDHIGVFLSMNSNNELAVTVLKTIGAISFPIFAFLLVEGALKTSNIKKYMLRLGIMSLIIGVALIIAQYVPYFQTVILDAKLANIFLMLFLAALTIYCLELPKWKKLYSLLPIAYVITTYIFLIFQNQKDLIIPDFISKFPMALIPDFTLYGFTMIIGIYLIEKYYLKTINKALKDEDQIEAFKQTQAFQFKYNSFAIAIIAIVIVLMTAFQYIEPLKVLNVYPTNFLSYGLLSALFIILYNGNIGYNNKVIKYSFYAYYPMHIILLLIIFSLI